MYDLIVHVSLQKFAYVYIYVAGSAKVALNEIISTMFFSKCYFTECFKT